MSAASPPSAPGQCVVCGVETNQKCSSCNKSGLDWMYFCSVEHQKLIWKVHKRFCGQNPFRWPILTEKEVKEAWKRRNLPIRPERPTTWLEAINGHFDKSPLTVTDRADPTGSEAYWQRSFEMLSKPLNTSLQQGALVMARTGSLCTKLVEIADLDESSLRTERARLFSENPIEHLSLYLDQAEARPQADSILSSDCRHRLIILYSILAVQLEFKFKDKLDWKQDSHVQHAISAVESPTSVQDSSEAREIVSKMIRTALNAWE